MREQACTFTGHRRIPSLQRAHIAQALETAIRDLIAQGVCVFYAGGALGFDTMAAQTVERLKASFPSIRLILALPCREQAYRWHADDVACYEQLCAQADEVVYVSEHYHSGCMHRRNRYLAEHSRYCIAYLTHAKSGTYYTVSYCLQIGVRVLNLATALDPTFPF